MKNGKLFIKNFLVILTIAGFTSCIFAFDYIPKNVNSNPFESKTGGKAGGKLESKPINVIQNNKQTAQPEMREITNLKEYFMYLPAEVHRHWTPYKADKDYDVTVEFTIFRNGSISDVHIVGTSYPNANSSVLNAVKSGAPYQPLPKSYTANSVKAQVILEYHVK